MTVKEKEEYLFKIVRRALSWWGVKKLTKAQEAQLADLIMLELFDIK
jgi:hypothetical protein